LVIGSFIPLRTQPLLQKSLNSLTICFIHASLPQSIILIAFQENESLNAVEKTSIN
jgi:hypothetical protein